METQEQRYERETGKTNTVIFEAGYFEGKVVRYTKEYTEWLETGKAKAEQERDEVIDEAIDFANLLLCYAENPRHLERARKFIDKHKESV